MANINKGYGIYPNIQQLTDDEQRLRNCTNLENGIKNDVETNFQELRKLKKKKNKLDKISTGMLGFASALSIGGVALTTTVFGTIVGAPLVGVSVVVGLLSQIPNKFKNDVEKEIIKQKEYGVLISSTLSEIKQNINKYLNDGVISKEEYEQILKDFDKFSRKKYELFSQENKEKKLTKKEVQTIQNENVAKLVSVVDALVKKG